MKLTAQRIDQWPTGCHWTTGETRDIEVPKGAEIPDWLVPAKAKKAKAKKAD